MRDVAAFSAGDEFFLDRDEAFRAARRRQDFVGVPHFVGRCPGLAPHEWMVTTAAPLLGEWWDAEGIKHG